jgi:hypothetical protein
MRRIRVVLALALAALASAPAARADAGDVLRWQLIGHIADTPVVWLAVPPDGISSGGAMYAYVLDAPATVSIAPKPGSTRRSRDGGQTWERLPAEPPAKITLPPGGAPLFSFTESAVFRSSDDGASWNSVTPLSGRDSELIFSPAFAADGTAFLRTNDQLLRSTDRGASWTSLDPGEGQVISSARLSPAFAADQTIFVGAISARPKATSINIPLTDNADSVGLLVSHDAGSTWTSLADGLQIDGAPYRQVLDIGVSPGFAADQTLFVSTFGPWAGGGVNVACSRCVGPSAAVFRSRDAGGSWAAVNSWTFAGWAFGAPLFVSASFPSDQSLEQGFDVEGGSPGSTICTTDSSTDAGDSWTSAEVSRQTSQGMCAIGVTRAAGQTVMLAYQRPSYLSSSANRNIMRSLDGGSSWTILQPPGDGLIRGVQADLTQRQVVLPDRVLQATQQGDLWAYAAWPPCTTRPQLGFGQVWSEHPDWQEAAGCPVGPEQAVDIQTRHVEQAGRPPTDYYWTSGSDAVCLQVYSDTFSGETHGGAADAKNCGGDAARTLQGSSLRFANHQYWLYIPDSAGHGQVVSSMNAGVVAVP